MTAPLVTISIEERVLAPVAPLLRVLYLERLLEAVRDGTPLDRLSDALWPLRDKEKDSAEPECQCPPPALTPHQSKQPARGGVCLARKTGCDICHVSHLREDSTAHCQRIRKAPKGLQLVWQTT